MQRVLWLLLLVSWGGSLRAHDGVLELGDLIQEGATWLGGHGDPVLVEGRKGVDQGQVTRLLREVRDRFRGEYVIDLTLLKQAVNVVLSVLPSDHATACYAAWLRGRGPDFDLSGHFRLRVMPPETEKWESACESWDANRQGGLWRVELGGRSKPGNTDFDVRRLKPIFRSMQVPVELVWVAEVESGFDPRAVSPVGAAGLYQLMPATARQYGLVLEPDDDRFHPEKNARAAARHMYYLGGVFDDWHLAMAAYNAGHNRVRSLLAKHKARSFDEIAAYLPVETQLFVPKVDATLMRREGVSLAGLASRVP